MTFLKSNMYQTDKTRPNKGLYLQCNNNLNFQKMLRKFQQISKWRK